MLKSTEGLEMFDASAFITESAEKMQNEIDDIAIIACSGGVDSTVAAVIANQAIGDKLHCVYVDTGLMRKNETEEIQEMLAAHGLNLTTCLLYTSPSPRDLSTSRMPSSA